MESSFLGRLRTSNNLVRPRHFFPSSSPPSSAASTPGPERSRSCFLRVAEPCLGGAGSQRQCRLSRALVAQVLTPIHPLIHPLPPLVTLFLFLFESCWTENTRLAVGVAGVAFVQLRVEFMFAKRSCPRPSPNSKGYRWFTGADEIDSLCASRKAVSNPHRWVNSVRLHQVIAGWCVFLDVLTGFPVVVLDLAGTPPPQTPSAVSPAPTSTQHCRTLTATAASKHCPAFALPASPRQSSRSATLSKWERRLESRSPSSLSLLHPHPQGAAKGCN